MGAKDQRPAKHPKKDDIDEQTDGMQVPERRIPDHSKVLLTSCANEPNNKIISSL
jgi:hypothetical protein